MYSFVCFQQAWSSYCSQIRIPVVSHSAPAPCRRSLIYEGGLEEQLRRHVQGPINPSAPTSADALATQSSSGDPILYITPLGVVAAMFSAHMCLATVRQLYPSNVVRQATLPDPVLRNSQNSFLYL